MKAFLFIAAAAAALASPAAAAPVRHAAHAIRHVAPAARDWTRIVVATAEGGFRMGNPNARVKLVEYGSLSCPYCRKFDQEGVPTLRDKLVRSGRVSWEYRTYLNHPTDPAVSALVHCMGASSFFPIAEQLYATQPQWFGRLVAYPKQQYQQLQTLPVLQRNAAIAHITGLDAFFVRHGMPSSKVRSCLADEAVLDKLAAIAERGDNEGVDGTPSFFINGVKNSSHEWSTLEPLIRSAGG